MSGQSCPDQKTSLTSLAKPRACPSGVYPATTDFSQERRPCSELRPSTNVWVKSLKQISSSVALVSGKAAGEFLSIGATACQRVRLVGIW